MLFLEGKCEITAKDFCVVNELDTALVTDPRNKSLGLVNLVFNSLFFSFLFFVLFCFCFCLSVLQVLCCSVKRRKSYET